MVGCLNDLNVYSGARFSRNSQFAFSLKNAIYVQFFMYDHDPVGRAPHIVNNFFHGFAFPTDI